MSTRMMEDTFRRFNDGQFEEKDYGEKRNDGKKWADDKKSVGGRNMG